MSHSKSDRDVMLATWRPGPGLKRRERENWADALVRAIRAGKGPVIPGYIYRDLSPHEAGSILDFGCGVGATDGALHVQALRALDFEVYGHDFEPEPDTNRHRVYEALVDHRLIDPQALNYTYDIVMANNVLNVQPSRSAANRTLRDIKQAMDDKTLLIVNIPSSPKGIWESNAQFNQWLEQAFRAVDVVEAGIWACRGKRR